MSLSALCLSHFGGFAFSIEKFAYASTFLPFDMANGRKKRSRLRVRRSLSEWAFGGGFATLFNNFERASVPYAERTTNAWKR